MLHIAIGMKTRKAVVSYVPPMTGRNVMMLCGDGRFPPSPEEEGSVPTGSM